MPSKKSLLVVGTGAVGGTLLVRLQQAAVKAVALTTQDSYQRILQSGLKVKLSDNHEYLYLGEVYYSLPDDYFFDYAIITTKSYVNATIQPVLEKKMNKDSSILIFQNGIGIEGPFMKKKEWTIIRAVSSFGAFRENKVSIIEKGVGKTKIGLIAGNNRKILEFWKSVK